MTVTRIHVIGSVISDIVDDDTLAAAKAGDRDAGASVLKELEGRFERLAARAAAMAFTDDKAHLRAAYQEDFLQDAYLAAWECLVKTEDETLDGFRAYAYTTAERTLMEKASELKNGSNDDREGKKLFAQMVKRFRDADTNHLMTEADYLSLAESAVQDKAAVKALNNGAYASRVRMSPEAAAAARLAYQGVVSIHRPVGESEDGSTTIADTLVSRDSVEELADLGLGGVRPFQWTVAARVVEAELTLPRDQEARSALLNAVDRFRAGTILAEDLDLLEAQPCRSKALGDAVAMLRSLFNQRDEDPAPSQADKAVAAALGRGSVALNAQRAILDKALDDAVNRALVRRVVGMMGAAQAYVLAATFGLGQIGTFKDDKALARAMVKAGFDGMDAPKVAVYRRKARLAFAKKWSDLIAKNGSERDALLAAAAKAGLPLDEALAED